MQDAAEHGCRIGRRGLLGGAGAFGALALAAPARAADSVTLGFPGGVDRRALTDAFPQKVRMILQRSRPPLLETPFEVFDQGVFTPNDRFFVRWHWAGIPTEIDPAAFRLTVRGHVTRPLTLTLADLAAMERVEIAAVNQCSGNSRGYFAPRVAGGQWGNGAIGNARWAGVRLSDVLDRAGIRPGAVAVRFTGLDKPMVDDAPDFMKSLDLDHARDGEVMLADTMNGARLPLLNGFPLRLVVPGWYSTYWVKMLDDIEVLDRPDENFWMRTAYRIPATPHADMRPGEKGVPTVPINRMVPRSWITNLADGQRIAPGAPVALRGIAMGGDCGVARVDVSSDDGTSWRAAALGPEEGRYGFRRWTAQTAAPAGTGALTLLARCTNTQGKAQPMAPNWNGGGFMRNVVERMRLTVGS